VDDVDGRGERAQVADDWNRQQIELVCGIAELRRVDDR
jgi:hypothetical protein